MAAQTNNSAYTNLFLTDTTAIAYANATASTIVTATAIAYADATTNATANATADAGATADATTDATASTITCLLFPQLSLGGPIRELHGESIWECSSNNIQCSELCMCTVI